MQFVNFGDEVGDLTTESYATGRSRLWRGDAKGIAFAFWACSSMEADAAAAT